MSRFEGKLTAAGDASLPPADYAGLGAKEIEEARRQAIARCLAGGDGWQEAVRELRGAFAAEAAPPKG